MLTPQPPPCSISLSLVNYWGGWVLLLPRRSAMWGCSVVCITLSSDWRPGFAVKGLYTHSLTLQLHSQIQVTLPRVYTWLHHRLIPGGEKASFSITHKHTLIRALYTMCIRSSFYSASPPTPTQTHLWSNSACNKGLALIMFHTPHFPVLIRKNKNLVLISILKRVIIAHLS